MKHDSTRRFSSRVENYVRYRPSYPPEVIRLLENECGLTPDAVVADVGSGTGILTRLLLEHGNEVYGVEPNPEMRHAAERLLADWPRFHSVSGTAETTTLPDRCVDLVTAGQAFHWFDRARSRDEAARILRPGGMVALIWNDRHLHTTPFLRDFEALLHRYGTDYVEVNHHRPEAELLGDFFAPHGHRVATFENTQQFDLEGLTGRLLSASYTPERGHPNHAPMLQALRDLFERHQEGGRVHFDYDTKVYYGRVTAHGG